MNPSVLKTYILSIIVTGLLIMLVGILLYYYRSELSANVRFFMPIPPLAVAAYIFVFNMFDHYNGSIPDGFWANAKEVLYATSIAALTFGVFALLILVIVNFMKR